MIKKNILLIVYALVFMGFGAFLAYPSNPRQLLMQLPDDQAKEFISDVNRSYYQTKMKLFLVQEGRAELPLNADFSLDIHPINPGSVVLFDDGELFDFVNNGFEFSQNNAPPSSFALLFRNITLINSASEYNKCIAPPSSANPCR